MGVDDWLLARFKPWQVVSACVALVAVALAFGPESHRADIDDCRDRVRASLKAPSTAEFGTENVRERDGGTVIVGVVDAENGFGAQVRSTYRCEVDESGVTLVSLD